MKKIFFLLFISIILGMASNIFAKNEKILKAIQMQESGSYKESGISYSIGDKKILNMNLKVNQKLLDDIKEKDPNYTRYVKEKSKIVNGKKVIYYELYLAKGAFQIHPDYWTDAKEYALNKKLINKDDYIYEKDVWNIEKSRNITTWYMQRYEKNAWDNGINEILAKLHNGGLNWRKYPNVKKYWADVKEKLAKL
jgi:hypothetical protein